MKVSSTPGAAGVASLTYLATASSCGTSPVHSRRPSRVNGSDVTDFGTPNASWLGPGATAWSGGSGQGGAGGLCTASSATCWKGNTATTKAGSVGTRRTSLRGVRVVEHEVVEVEAQVQQVVAAEDEDLPGRDRCRRQSRAQRPARQGTRRRDSRQEPQAGQARRSPECGRAAEELEDGAPVQLAGTLSCQEDPPSSCRPVVASMTDAVPKSTLDLATWA